MCVVPSYAKRLGMKYLSYKNPKKLKLYPTKKTYPHPLTEGPLIIIFLVELYLDETPYRQKQCFRDVSAFPDFFFSPRLCLDAKSLRKVKLKSTIALFLYVVNIVLSWFISQRTSKLCNKLFCLSTFSVPYIYVISYI